MTHTSYEVGHTAVGGDTLVLRFWRGEIVAVDVNPLNEQRDHASKVRERFGHEVLNKFILYPVHKTD